MPLNTGVIELGGGGIDIKIYYDVNYLINNPTGSSDNAPLVDGPRGFCLDMTNTTGSNYKLTVYGLTNNPLTIQVGQGDPVNTGPASGRSRTAAQMASLGLTTRGSVGQVSVE